MAGARKWSKHVTETSDAMDVEPGTFKQSDPAKIADAVERDAERSTRRKESPYRAAMSMLTFYINRAGANLTAKQRKVLEDAKDVLREHYGPGGTSASAKRSAAKRTVTKPRAKKTTRTAARKR
jgi:hypothetical protein